MKKLRIKHIFPQKNGFWFERLTNFTNKKVFFSTFLFWLAFSATAQPQITQRDQYWLGYMTQGQISERWGCFNDFHFVPRGFIVLRTGLTFMPHKKLNLTTTVGYAKVYLYPSRTDFKTLRPEHRPWGQTVYIHGLGKRWRVLHRLRYDARYRRKMQGDALAEGYHFNWRWRYMGQVRYNFPKKDTQQGNYYGVLAIELLYNSGKEIKNHFRLDQSRILLGAGYQRKQVSYQLSYMNRTVLSATRDDTYTMNHTLVLWIFHNYHLFKRN